MVVPFPRLATVVAKKMRTYQRCGVPHDWLLDPVAEALLVHRWTESGYPIAFPRRDATATSAPC